MTLANRVSLFFLIALGISLGGYSLLGYFLIREHLVQEFDDQLESGFNAIVAAVEVEEDSVKWQRAEHNIVVGRKNAEHDLVWSIIAPQALVVDSSEDFDRVLNSSESFAEFIKQMDSALESQPDWDEVIEMQSWRILRRRLTAPDPKSKGEMDSDEFSELTVIAARSTKQLEGDLRNLAWLFSLLFSGLWASGALLCRKFVQRALAPLASIARQVEETKANFDLRLTVLKPHDELRELSSSFNAMMDELQQAFKKQERFAGDAAHQLRTPLAALSGEIDVTLRRPRQPEEYQHSLGILKSQVTRLNQIVESLLFLARAEGESTISEKQRIGLAEWWCEYVERWKAHHRFVDFHVRISPGTSVIASQPLFEQALDNLLENAIKYSDPGTPISIVASRQGEMSSVAVEDQGFGIFPQEQVAIFEPFYRSPHARKSGTEGIGLGLALVARIAKSLGGHIRYEPATTKGSRFILTLPS